jgi:hypothetical protein
MAKFFLRVDNLDASLSKRCKRIRVEAVQIIQLFILGIDSGLHTLEGVLEKIDDWLLRLSFRVGDCSR